MLVWRMQGCPGHSVSPSDYLRAAGGRGDFSDIISFLRTPDESPDPALGRVFTVHLLYSVYTVEQNKHCVVIVENEHCVAFVQNEHICSCCTT